MKRGSRFLVLIVICLIPIFVCTTKTSVTNPKTGGETPISSQDQQAITTSFSGISALADTALTSSDPATALSAVKASVLSDTTIDSIWITGNALHVSYKKGGIISWVIAGTATIPPYITTTAKRKVSARGVLRAGIAGDFVGNRKACLINQQYGDDSRQYCKDLITHLSQEFKSDSYSVDTFNGSDADVDFFGTNLSDYGAVFDISHGCYDGTNTWLCTGEEATLQDLMTTYPVEWKTNEMTLMTCKEIHSGNSVNVRFYGVSNLFFGAKYAAGSFPHSLVYFVACQSLMDPEWKLEATLNDKGAAAICGWTETNCLGQATGQLLFDAMLGGARLDSAWANLPDEAKTDPCAFPKEATHPAQLGYYPAGGGSIRLVDTSTTQIVITTPVNNDSSTSRTAYLTGYLTGAAYLLNGTVEVNGVATTLTVLNDTQFNQEIELKPGWNVIWVNAYGMKGDSTRTFNSQDVSVYGQFDTLPLWTELRWNMNGDDVDLHLLPPGATTADLWTTTDCYFANPTPGWGGSLDFDNTVGYGPEHITIPTLLDSGTYTLCVHYWADHGGGPTSASVTVSTYGGENQDFGPYLLSTPKYDASGDTTGGPGDVWQVCTITLPGGTVQGMSKKVVLTAAAAKRIAGLPRKK